MRSLRFHVRICHVVRVWNSSMIKEVQTDRVHTDRVHTDKDQTDRVQTDRV